MTWDWRKAHYGKNYSVSAKKCLKKENKKIDSCRTENNAG